MKVRYFLCWWVSNIKMLFKGIAKIKKQNKNPNKTGTEMPDLVFFSLSHWILRTVDGNPATKIDRVC